MNFVVQKKKRKELGTSRRISPSAESESPTRSQKQEQIPWTAPPFLRRSIQVKGACSGACLCLQRVDVKKDLRFCVWTTGWNPQSRNQLTWPCQPWGLAADQEAVKDSCLGSTRAVLLPPPENHRKEFCKDDPQTVMGEGRRGWFPRILLETHIKLALWTTSWSGANQGTRMSDHRHPRHFLQTYPTPNSMQSPLFLNPFNPFNTPALSWGNCSPEQTSSLFKEVNCKRRFFWEVWKLGTHVPPTPHKALWVCMLEIAWHGGERKGMWSRVEIVS